MMKEGLDHDALLLLERRLGWKASEKLEDKLQDRELVAALEELEFRHAVLIRETEPRPGFVDAVMAEIGQVHGSAGRESFLVLTMHGLLAALGCFVGLLTVFAGSAELGSTWILPGLASVAFGIGSAQRAWRDSPA